ncbi:histidinol dehydrogenase [Nafulsella turpanensis]|uniref:histidinol dehydrogenase n=1 Tax=Nafulsella turpanensis TaxID=1265690 RepID=UPI00034AC842|nr:histidinol dehydrogenase [Nafulsella turpanensis]
MEIIVNPERSRWPELLERPRQEQKRIKKIIKPILKKVKRNGDSALLKFALEFDLVHLEEVVVSDNELLSAADEINGELKEAIQLAKQNIETFHKAQMGERLVVETMPGVRCSRKSVAIEKVGLYIPGGTAPLFSTVLMLGIPARLAGCKEIVLCTPPDRSGKIHPAILYTAHLLGIRKVFKTGGAQAIGAMMYGTESVPKVDKIFGPGNQYVTAAKLKAAKEGIAIDMPAGPSEVAVYADVSAHPAFVAADLLSQAEHGADSQVVLVATSKEIAEAIQKEVETQLQDLPRKEMAQQALENSRFLVVSREADAIDLLNAYAAEHLILSVHNYGEVAEKIINAGSVFLGNYSPESAGDYASGTNHTLPTNGFARAYSGVSVDSFVKKITFQEISPEGLKNIGPAIETMAEAEHLQAHANAVSLRLQQIKNNG